jgi:aryl-alcohol dehydrogenase-like predicted oxidoreductase
MSATDGSARRVALGSVQFGLPYGVANESGQVAPGEAARIVRIAADRGVDTIDTAIGYRDSERVLGDIGVAGFKVVTKLPALPQDVLDVSRWASEQVEGALTRLRAPRLHGLLLHRSADLLGPHGVALYRAMQAVKGRGLVGKIGVSVYTPDELGTLLASFAIDLVQAPLNLLDRRLQSSGWLARLNDAGVEVHTRSAFLQGLLLMPRQRIPARFAAWSSLWDRWDRWADGDRRVALKACLAFPLSLPEVDRVVVGVDSAEQFEEILLGAVSERAAWPDLSCDDEALINPSNWALQ